MRLLRLINPTIATLLVGALVLVGAGLTFVTRTTTATVTADFPRTVSLYKGSDVRILGVAVGKVDEVVPDGTKVRVRFSYDAKYKLPADVEAAVISPSIVGDRFIQLTPVYTEGPVAPAKLHLGLDRTAIPLELDEIFASLNEMAIAMGPDQANRPGSSGVGPLTRLLDTTAKNFGGQGVQFNTMLHNLAKFTDTLADNKDDLFETIEEVEEFTQRLAKNDDTVRRFADALAEGAALAAGERHELEAVFTSLSTAMEDVRTFVKDNRDLLTANVERLTRVSKIVVKNRDSLTEALSAGPVALNNLGLAYNETTGTLDTRANLFEGLNQMAAKPSIVLCGMLPDLCNVITPLLKIFGLGRPAPGAAATPDEGRIDRSLAGLVEVAP